MWPNPQWCYSKLQTVMNEINKEPNHLWFPKMNGLIISWINVVRIKLCQCREAKSQHHGQQEKKINFVESCRAFVATTLF